MCIEHTKVNRRVYVEMENGNLPRLFVIKTTLTVSSVLDRLDPTTGFLTFLSVSMAESGLFLFIFSSLLFFFYSFSLSFVSFRGTLGRWKMESNRLHRLYFVCLVLFVYCSVVLLLFFFFLR